LKNITSEVIGYHYTDKLFMYVLEIGSNSQDQTQNSTNLVS